MAARSIIRVLLMTAIVGVAFQKHASADTISYTASFGPTASPFNMTYTFAGFDPTLGTLNSVSLYADESMTTTGSITNLSQYTGPWQIQLDGGVHVLFTNAAGVSGIGSPPVVPAKFVTVPSIDPNTPYVANISTADLNSVVLDANLVLVGESVAQFFEAGPISGNLNAGGVSQISVPDGVTYSSSLTTSISGSFSVIYNYTPTSVPEPASGQMIAMGLTGLIAITRKTRRRHSGA